ncbi:triose-phosphate isomerase [Microcella sp.]|uniref:triose-phosphate isomerase n=1 Tax=Microcella sp. TaxID=1913979 RepID=UPI003F6EC937
MAVARTPLIAGNWKMNLDHLQSIAFVQKLAWSLRDAKHDYGQVEVAVFPPFTDLRSVQTLVTADKLELRYGGQDLSVHDSGAYTGEISGAFLAALDCRYVIIGHSERRQYHAETDQVVADKTAAALRHGLVPVICVGETADDLEQHGPSAVPVAQLTAVLQGLAADAEIVVAYEPVWAIGSGQAATPEQAQQVCAALRDVISATLGDEAAARTRILYGGSVKAANIAGFMKHKDVDGALVGGASLDVDEFSSIARFPKHVGTA